MYKDHFWIDYRFHFYNERPDMHFTVLLDKTTMVALPPEESEPQEWTRLSFCQCDICPLEPEDGAQCPVAYNISGLAGKFTDVYSIEQAQMVVTVPEREYSKEGKVTEGLRSLIGVYLATSGCPHMSLLKPMARFHLPFASMMETVYRHVGNYLLWQYCKSNDDTQVPDLTLQGLLEKNDKTNMVNRGICKRLEQVTAADANRNALAILGTIALILQQELNTHLESLKPLYDGIS